MAKAKSQASLDTPLPKMSVRPAWLRSSSDPARRGRAVAQGQHGKPQRCAVVRGKYRRPYFPLRQNRMNSSLYPAQILRVFQRIQHDHHVEPTVSFLTQEHDATIYCPLRG